MKTVAVVGSQWGDEGKGKIVDVITRQARWVVRYQGGNNAGHTVVVDGKTVKLNLLPSGVLREGCRVAIGAGVVLDARALLAEIESVKGGGIVVSPERLLVDGRVQLVLPYHREIDRAREEARGTHKIGTTLRGIGPAYEERAARGGLRLADLVDEAVYVPVLKERLKEVSRYLSACFGVTQELSLEQHLEELALIRERVIPFMGDVSLTISRAIRAEERIVFEGAQGCLLDVAFGTVPFVTSSHTTAGGIAGGVGVGPRSVERVLGLVKAYTTRVGSGPFPTELLDDIGDRLRERGAEFGTVTGRPRRCGWLDVVALRYAIRVSGIDWIALTKLDVLSGCSTIRICEGYKLADGTVCDEMPIFGRASQDIVPIYNELPGWDDDISSVRSFADLPVNARRYLEYVATITERPVVMVGVGQSRDATVWTPDTPQELYEFVGA
jgi:adenylosuccinate synthase